MTPGCNGTERNPTTRKRSTQNSKFQKNGGRSRHRCKDDRTEVPTSWPPTVGRERKGLDPKHRCLNLDEVRPTLCRQRGVPLATERSRGTQGSRPGLEPRTPTTADTRVTLWRADFVDLTPYRKSRNRVTARKRHTSKGPRPAPY